MQVQAKMAETERRVERSVVFCVVSSCLVSSAVSRAVDLTVMRSVSASRRAGDAWSLGNAHAEPAVPFKLESRTTAMPQISCGVFTNNRLRARGTKFDVVSVERERKKQRKRFRTLRFKRVSGGVAPQ